MLAIVKLLGIARKGAMKSSVLNEIIIIIFNLFYSSFC